MYKAGRPYHGRMISSPPPSSLHSLFEAQHRASRAQVEVPLAEDLESYDVQILDGAAVKRTLTSATTSVLYTASQQTADWGASLGPGQSLAIRIFQLSALIGRGAGRSVTLSF